MRDLFILHADAEADATFVSARLVPALGLEPDQVLLSSELPDGTSILQAMEEGVTASRVTVAVVSPMFLHDRWAVFGETLAGHHAIHGGLLVPLLLFDCAVPLRLDFRVKLDCRDERHCTAEIGRLRELLALPEPPPQAIPCPYPGMRPFAAENAALFCGRDRDVDDLVRRIAGGCRELYVVGPSGCGKSSLLLSGVVPRLERAGDPTVGERFEVRVLRPGEQPALRLAAAIASTAPRAAPDRSPAPAPRTLVVIDQLEEIFTLARRDARRDFFAALDALRADPTRHLVFTLRADFLGALMQSALWPHVRRSHRHELEPLRGDDLRTAITVPARRVGVELEPALVDRLLADAADEPGSLPLIQESLVHLWAKRERNLLTAAAYADLGDGDTSGLAAALSRRADRAFTNLGAGGQAVARRVFLRLVSFGEGRADTRRQQPLSALRAGEDPERLAATVRHLTEHRLLTADGDERSGETLLDLAHETLIASWSTLRDWIRAFRKHEQQRRKLEAEAADWIGRVAQDRHAVGLLDAGQLTELGGWLTADTTRDLGLSGDVRAFLAASEAAVAAQLLAEQARRRRWRRWVTVALVVLTAAVVAVSTLAVIAGQRSEDALTQKRIATDKTREALELATDKKREAQRQLARNYVAQGQALLLEGRGLQAAPYLLAARKAAEAAGVAEKAAADVPLRTMFRWATRYWPRVIFDHQASAIGVAWSPDGTRIATASLDHTARVWDATTGQPVLPPLAHQADVLAVAWSSDGTLVATASGDTAQVWDARTGQPVWPPLAHRGEVTDVAWSPDGTRVATAGKDETARVWDAGTGKPVSPPLAHQGEVWAVAWSPDGTRVATASADKTAQVWDARTGRPVSPPVAHKGEVRAVAWSPDGTRVATASADKTARVWDAGTGKPVSPPLAHKGEVWAVAWSPDGTRVATASADKTARVWDAVAGYSGSAPLAHYDRVNAVAWNPEGTRVATASFDKTARVWDARTGQAVSLPLEHQSEVLRVAWNPEGTRVATASFDKTARVWDARTGLAVSLPLGHKNIVQAVAWSPDGTRVATASDGARVWDAGTGKPVSPPLAHKGEVWAVAWSPDGTRVATASADKTARVWDAVAGYSGSAPLAHYDRVNAVAWSPDGTQVATASADSTARVWNARTGQQVSQLEHQADVIAVAWSPGGRWLATASADDTARVWDRTGEPVLQHEHHADVIAVAWSPGGRWLATASADGTARVWARTGQPVSRLKHKADVIAVAWSPDGTWVATASLDHTARVWDARTGLPVSPPLDHQGEVRAVAWSPDGTRVATASKDKSARVWDARTGQLVSPLLEHQGEVRAVAWSPDGKRLATGSDDKTARLWDVSWDTGTWEDWQTALRYCPYVLNQNGVLVARDAPVPFADLPFADLPFADAPSSTPPSP